MFLVCSYHIFRGLERPKITATADRDIYILQHYLLETLARFSWAQLFYKRTKLLQIYRKGIGLFHDNRMEMEWNRIETNDLVNQKKAID